MTWTSGPELRERCTAHLSAFEPRDVEIAERRLAAVALAVVPGPGGEACLVLTRRASGLRRHSGQWALPGGRLDKGETSLQAALREMHEEIGLELIPGDAIGRLDIHLSRSGFAMAPIVFWCDEDPELEPDPEEVAAIYRVPLADLARDDALQIIEWDGGRKLPVMSLETVGEIVFSPTAAILHQFAEVAVHGRRTRVAHFEEPRFAWR